MHCLITLTFVIDRRGSRFGGHHAFALRRRATRSARGCSARPVSAVRQWRGVAIALPRLPVFLRFDHRRVVVVGGGTVAASKIPALLAAGAQVTVIAPDDRHRRSIARACGRSSGEFEPADLDGAWFVTAAATPDVNREVREAAEARGVFVNAVDDPAERDGLSRRHDRARRRHRRVFDRRRGAGAGRACCARRSTTLLPADIDAWVERARELEPAATRAKACRCRARRPQLLDALNRLYDDARLGEPAIAAVMRTRGIASRSSAPGPGIRTT